MRQTRGGVVVHARKKARGCGRDKTEEDSKAGTDIGVKQQKFEQRQPRGQLQPESDEQTFSNHIEDIHR